AATLIVGDERIPFERRHPEGFFVARVASQGRPLYELELEGHDGVRRCRHDPYGFGSSIDQSDVAALREIGTNTVY
ncbi:hypothetical protein, partial [Enterobacter hormaechei]